jgi:hypothetical protein
MGAEIDRPLLLGVTMSNDLSRRDFIKGAVVTIGGLIGTVISLPPSNICFSWFEGREDTDTIDLPLENYPIGIPALRDDPHKSEWLERRQHHGLFVEKSETEVRVFSTYVHILAAASWHETRSITSAPASGHF